MFPGEQDLTHSGPFPCSLSHSRKNTLSRDNLYRDTPEHKSVVRAIRRQQQHAVGEKCPIHRPRSTDYTVGLPGTQGWGSTTMAEAFDPRLGLFVANVNNLGPARCGLFVTRTVAYSNSGPLAGTVPLLGTPVIICPVPQRPWGPTSGQSM